MREILFKAKRKDNGEWVEGYLLKKYYQELPHDRFAIQYKTKVAEYEWTPKYLTTEIDPETICQYTGLTDKNGNKIWEGDIVHLFGKDTIRSYDWKAVVEFGNPNGLYSWGYQLKPIGDFEYNEDILCWVGMEETNIYCNVIGNIFDNFFYDKIRWQKARREYEENNTKIDIQRSQK